MGNKKKITFDSVASRITGNIARASSKEIALICRRTFQGIKELLSAPLGHLPESSVFDAEQSLYKILEVYRNLEDKGGVENVILEEILIIKPRLNKAVSRINAAATNRREAKRAQQLMQNKDEYYKYLPLYNDAINECYDQVAEICRIIDRLDDIDTG